STRIEQLETRHTRGDRHVVMRARLHAVEAEGAIEVTDLRGQEERQLASPLHDSGGNGLIPAAFDAVNGSTRRAGLRPPNPQLERRHRRSHETELADRAHILAEGRAGEEKID